MVCILSYPGIGIVAGLVFTLSANTILASPALLPAHSSLELGVRATSKTNFASSCTDIAYFGYCRIEANCTSDGSAASKAKAEGSGLGHTFLDLGQCVGYDDKAKALKWRSKSIAHWQSTYCAPCSQCTIDPTTTVMTCQCQYPDKTSNHATKLKLSDHVSNTDGVLSCLNVAGASDKHS